MPLYQDLVSVINATRSNEGEKSLYQGNKLMNYSREKRYLFGGEEKYEVNVNSLSNHLTLSFIYICALTFNIFAL